MADTIAASSETGVASEGMSAIQTFTIAVACGVLAANLYYAQPLIGMIGHAVGLGDGVAGLVVTATQLGYALGLIFLVPVGDFVENRRLIVATVAVNVLSLAGLVVSSDATGFFIAMVAVGCSSTAAQLLIPLAASMTPPARRGAVVGRVMSGLLTGILLARPVASFLAGAIGWRGVFIVSAVLIALIGLALARTLPDREQHSRSSYFALIASLGRLLVDEPVLRRRGFYHAMMFAAFSLFWTGAPLLLLSPAYGFSQDEVALFALAGVLGVFAAPVAGYLADRGHGFATTAAALATGILAFALALFGETSFIALVAAAVLIDLGVQANMVVSQREIFALAPSIRNRLNAVYMATFFAGGALGSALTSPTIHYFGWYAFAALGIAFPAIALIAFLVIDGRRG